MTIACNFSGEGKREKMSNSTKVLLGGVEYEISALTIKYSRAWRETFGSMLNPIISALAQFGGIDIENPENWRDLSNLLATVKDSIIMAPDLCADATFSYSAELSKERGAIEESATDAEILDAFMQVMALAYPFGKLIRTVNRAGLTERGTGKK
jgi:hypothetical protein